MPNDVMPTNILNRTFSGVKPMRDLQMNGVKFVRTLIETLAGEDERPSAILKYMQSLDKDLNAGIELAQDGMLLAVEILKVLEKVANGQIEPFNIATQVTLAIIEVVPELKNDVEVIKSLDALRKHAGSARDSM